jgi:hypothetical protein
VLLRGGAVASPYATVTHLKTVSAAPPSAAAALLDPLDAATPAAIAACRRGNHDAGHLDVDASVGADEGGWLGVKCIGGGGAEGYRQFGLAHPCFYYSHQPI